MRKKIREVKEEWKDAVDLLNEWDDSKTTKRGEPDKDSFVTTIQENELGALYITVPHILVEKMGWNGDDNIEVSRTENCFDWGEVQSIVLRNLTKEGNDNETTD